MNAHSTSRTPFAPRLAKKMLKGYSAARAEEERSAPKTGQQQGRRWWTSRTAMAVVATVVGVAAVGIAWHFSR